MRVLWGLFCACSWTWCIGLYLPRIMIERWGWPGFIAFAVPNVVGCAAFGYVVRTPQRSRMLVQRHGTVMVGFSIITVAYHLFFIVWLFDELLPHLREHWWLPLAAAAIVYGLGLVFSFFDDRDFLVLTVIVYGTSLAAFWSVGFNAFEHIAWTGRDQRSELWWLVPTIAFGFLLCPYLDLTFHRALRRSHNRHSFAVFGLAFAAMILLTCLIWFSPKVIAERILPALALAHILTQCVFTVGAHLREVRLAPALVNAERRMLAMAAPLLAAPLLYLSRMFTDAPAGEDLYLRFLGFFGLIFPAYVFVFMTRSNASPQTWKIKAMFVGALIASLPCYELGFLHHRPWLLVLPLIILGGLRWFTPASKTDVPMDVIEP
jgi:hypothetical protein